MLKSKYYLIAIIFVLAAVAFKFNSLSVNSDIKEEETEPQIEIPPINHALEIQETLTKYDSLLSFEIEQSGNVGAAVVITYKGQVAFLKCFGFRKAGQKEKIDENTIFRLASVSKSITGVLAGILADEEIIDLDDKVVDYLPDFSLKNPGSTNNLTIRHILSHTTGLIPHAFDLMVEDHVPLNQIMERLKEVDVTSNPGEIYGYQNVMFSIFDPITFAKIKKGFDEVINEKVFDPFGMKDASTGFDAFKNNENKAFPHSRGNGEFMPIRLNDRYYNTAPAAGINASISDLGQLLIGISGKNGKLISQNARNMIFTPQVDSPLKRTYFRSWDKIDSKQYSIGWRIVNYKNRKIAYHGGYVLGYRAEIAFCEEEEIGIAFLSNSPNSSVSKSIPTFLNLFFESKEKLVQEEFSPKSSVQQKS